MSRKRNARRPAQVRDAERSVPAETRAPTSIISKNSVLVMDAYMNAMAKLGIGQGNFIDASTYPLTRLTQQYALMNSLYRGEWIVRRIIDTVPEDMLKNWYEITSQVDPDALKEMARVERQTCVKQKLIDGLRWGRLYGGCAGVIMIAGQEDMLDQPLNLQMIMPGQFTGIILADRWNGVYPSSELCEDLSDPEFGLPDYYTFSIDQENLSSGVRVHHSRVLRFIGRELPYIERLAESYWGMSEIEHIYAELNKRNGVSANLAQMIFQSNLRVLKMSDLGEVLATTSPEQQAQLYSIISAQNMLMNNMGVQVMDKEDSFESHQYSFSGLPELYQAFMLDITGASEIPATKLFGRSPEGMNATGESDMQNYYDKIHKDQESKVRPLLEKLLPVMCMSAWGMVPDDLEFEFNPVRDSSDQERANLVQQTSSAVVSAYQASLISQRTALKELRNTESFTGMWGSITDEEIEAADDGTIQTGGAEGFPAENPAPQQVPALMEPGAVPEAGNEQQ